MNKSILTRWTNKVINDLVFKPELEENLKVIVRNKLQRYHKIKKPSGRRSLERQQWLALSPTEKVTKVVQGLLNFQPKENSRFSSAAELIHHTAEYYND